MKNITISFPQKIEVKKGYQKLVGRDNDKFLLKAMRSRRNKARYAAAETLMKREGQTVLLNAFQHMTDRNKDIIIHDIIINMERK